MFAVIKTGGKQYRVAAEDRISVMRLGGEPGDIVTFDEVLTMTDASSSFIGSPFISGASVAAEIVQHHRSAKTISFKKRRRKNSKRKRGHRQDMTLVRITEFLTDGAQPSKMAKQSEASSAPRGLLNKDSDADGIAAGALASVVAAKVAGLDTDKFQRLDSAVGRADDIELISGVGPGIAQKLHDIGIYHFWQVAAMNEDDIDAIEREVGFKGRALHDQWKEQARELMDGKGPRAKVDQERLAKTLDHE